IGVEEVAGAIAREEVRSLVEIRLRRALHRPGRRHRLQLLRRKAGNRRLRYLERSLRDVLRRAERTLDRRTPNGAGRGRLLLVGVLGARLRLGAAEGAHWFPLSACWRRRSPPRATGRTRRPSAARAAGRAGTWLRCARSRPRLTSAAGRP